MNVLTEKDGLERTAKCGCGNLAVTARGEPIEVYACSCLNCQRESGGSFTYSAVYPSSAVSLVGDRKVWSRPGDSGRSVENEFCPTCGVTVSGRMEVWPDVVAVAVGCFADPSFPKPTKLYWASRHHSWLTFPEDIESMDTQPD